MLVPYEPVVVHATVLDRGKVASAHDKASASPPADCAHQIEGILNAQFVQISIAHSLNFRAARIERVNQMLSVPDCAAVAVRVVIARAVGIEVVVAGHSEEMSKRSQRGRGAIGPRDECVHRDLPFLKQQPGKRREQRFAAGIERPGACNIPLGADDFPIADDNGYGRHVRHRSIKLRGIHALGLRC